ncbi:heme ABC exporter ATP-binding protein CcmA [Sphingomonas dokdonensis]|uniref:Cytochrome c biogenesis ATP-binding export protein CcmA n=1 Tax=Sphingomonas dokdonensis TaxID=344880 RepID=A0A245ZK21_9SPHN|nr:heme ABC exporter ATP-binding protein CcmA [Sphingomonas dokdonensis]OWK30083.1 cytochrome c biogenesis ATP-binding export protein CcmA [Sphingomonas dokdonensis]
MSAALALSDLACRRGGRLLFAGVSCPLAAGDALVVTGANGCGKSSLLRMIAGLLPPFEGEVALSGRVALLGEASALDGDRTLGAALHFWAMLDGVADPAGCVARALDDVALAELGDVPVRLLSTGQRRRAALARVLASGAELWLLDEPATGLDMASIALLEAAVARHRERGGIAVIATHQPLAVAGAATLDLAAYRVAEAA